MIFISLPLLFYIIMLSIKNYNFDFNLMILYAKTEYTPINKIERDETWNGATCPLEVRTVQRDRVISACETTEKKGPDRADTRIT